ncbi:MAG TPA: transcription termination factor Rho, partial [Ilumatobacteraceae bacterium]
DEAVPAGGAPATASGVGDQQNRFQERPRDERPRDDRPRDERPRDDRPRDDRGRDDRPRVEGQRDDDRGPTAEPITVSGYLDLREEGYGFLRVNGYLASRDDAYVSVKQTRQLGLRRGDHVTGLMRPAGRNEKNAALLEIHSINGGDPDQARNRPKFEDLTPLFPDEKLTLSSPSDPTNMTARIIDLISPIGKGQRGLIVSPPKAGKTTIMKTIATSIERNNPEVKLIVLLIDERPEEVTDMRRTVQGEVIASTFDRPSEEHTHLAELAIERAKRMVESGQDVVIILDGITRLSRAYNLAAPATGRIMSGGIDAGALYPPKKFFGAARNIEEGGSLTILATALVETNSRMDDAIFEEFKGTGNMELRLDRKLAERRVFPAIDVDASSTRHEELLFDRKQLQLVWKLRRVLSGLAADGNAAPGLELLIDRLKSFRTNDEFLNEISKQPAA